MKTITFIVRGTPKPAGSKRAFYIPKLKRAVVVDACKLTKDWQADVKGAAVAALPPNWEPLAGPVSLTAKFWMPRTRSHYKKGTPENPIGLKPSAPHLHTKRPDLLKLTRAIEDALTGIIYRDDSQICNESLSKMFSEFSGVEITIAEVEQ